MGRRQGLDRDSQDASGSSDTEALFDAKSIPGLEGEHQLDGILDLAGHRLDLGKPASEILSQDARRSLVFGLQECRSPATEGRGSDIGRERCENRRPMFDQCVEPLFESSLQFLFREERMDLLGQLFVHGCKKSFHVGKMSEDRSYANIGSLGNLLCGR